MKCVGEITTHGETILVKKMSGRQMCSYGQYSLVNEKATGATAQERRAYHGAIMRVLARKCFGSVVLEKSSGLETPNEELDKWGFCKESRGYVNSIGEVNCVVVDHYRIMQ